MTGAGAGAAAGPATALPEMPVGTPATGVATAGAGPLVVAPTGDLQQLLQQQVMQLQQQLFLQQQLLQQQGIAPYSQNSFVAAPPDVRPAPMVVVHAGVQTETPVLKYNKRHAYSQTTEMRVASDEMEILKAKGKELTAELEEAHFQIAQLERQKKKEDRRFGDLNDEIGEHRQTISGLRQQLTTLNTLQAQADEGKHALQMLVQSRLDLARAEAELVAWKQQVQDLLTQAQCRPETQNVGTQAKDETDHLEEAALIEKIVRLEDALRNANQRESEREAAREQERISERRKLDSDVSLAPGSTAKADQLKELADRERRMAEAEAEATKRQHELELKDQLLMEEREDLEELLSELQLKRASLTEQETQITAREAQVQERELQVADQEAKLQKMFAEVMGQQGIAGDMKQAITN
mmetsp:Transcript_22478/g.35670  ORF Transcript_22478/g.35670 Transcript_22478/m.35670 type:complete len:412 (+) Transcript_22478:3-1238(+)